MDDIVKQMWKDVKSIQYASFDAALKRVMNSIDLGRVKKATEDLQLQRAIDEGVEAFINRPKEKDFFKIELTK